jgi:hypothetical protein
MPDSPCCLICPRQLLATSNDQAAFCSIHSYNITLNLRGRCITVKYNAHTDLPILYTATGPKSFLTFCHANHMSPSPQLHAALACNTVPNTNLSPSQMVKLQWHQQLNHVNFEQLCSLMHDGSIRISPAVVNSPNPICTGSFHSSTNMVTPPKPYYKPIKCFANLYAWKGLKSRQVDFAQAFTQAPIHKDVYMT